MKASFYALRTYPTTAGRTASSWPTPAATWDPDVGNLAMENILKQAARADEVGFDWVSFSEHHYMPQCLEPNPLVLAAAASQVVKRATIALLGPIVGFSNPIRTAEEIAMVDAMSGGRTVTLFLRSGGLEYGAYTSNLSESRERTQEASILIERALTEPQPFGWEGKHFSFRTVSVWPRLVNPPQFFYSGNSIESAEFAARRGWGLACSFFPPAFLGQVVERYKAEAARAGWEPTADQILYRGLSVIADTDEEAEAVAMPVQSAGNELAKGGMVGQAFGSLQFVGQPKTVIEQIKEIHDLGFGVVDVGFGVGSRDHEAVMRSLDLYGSEVLPAIHDFDDAVPVGGVAHADR